MGEIIFSVCVGGFLSLSGVALILVLHREEKGLNRTTTRPPGGPKGDAPPHSGKGDTVQ